MLMLIEIALGFANSHIVFCSSHDTNSIPIILHHRHCMGFTFYVVPLGFLIEFIAGQYLQQMSVDSTRGISTLNVLFGSQPLSVYRIGTLATTAVASLNGTVCRKVMFVLLRSCKLQPVSTTTTQVNEYGIVYLVLTFASQLNVAAGSSLVVTLSP